LVPWDVFTSILSHIIQLQLNFHLYICKRCQREAILWSYFGKWRIFRFLCWGACPLFFKNSWWANQSSLILSL
jgi:hypothetical protein